MAYHSLLLVILSLWWTSASPREWGTRWISHPEANDSSQVWFRKSVKTPVALSKGFITVASNGYFRLYVNERNVTIDPFLNYADSLPGIIHQYTFDVTRFLDNRENTIAVWYAPRTERHSDKQLSLDFYGEDMLGKRFFMQADGTWQCKEACAFSLPNGREEIDGQVYYSKWNSPDDNDKSWTHPIDSSDSSSALLFTTSPHYEGIKVRQVLNSTEVTRDSTSITYDFGRPFRGWVRITFRNAHKGERIEFGNHSYTCGSRMDEQAFPRFTVTDQRFVTIIGDDKFRHEQIQSVEGLEIDTYLHMHYVY